VHTSSIRTVLYNTQLSTEIILSSNMIRSQSLPNSIRIITVAILGHFVFLVVLSITHQVLLFALIKGNTVRPRIGILLGVEIVHGQSKVSENAIPQIFQLVHGLGL
jgi:hypothetical protein